MYHPPTRRPSRLALRLPAACRLIACAAVLASCAGCAGPYPAESSDPDPVFLASNAPDAPPARPELAPATLEIGGAKLNIAFTGDFSVPRDALLRWIETAANSVTRYYGRFPVDQVTIRVRGGTRGRVGSGWEFRGRFIRIDVGRSTRQADLDDDWMMTHEMFHLGFPDVMGRQEWMEEGLSTYLEPVARARAGIISEERFWRELVEGLPQGLPREGDRGLDRTLTWGRTYWGGCLYWLLADVEIRRQTGTRKSLDDAIRAILEAGGNGGARWDPQRVIEVGDGATGTTVLRDLHQRLGTTPERVDLGELWKQLGVVSRGGRVTFDDTAPLASVRRAITSRNTSD